MGRGLNVTLPQRPGNDFEVGGGGRKRLPGSKVTPTQNSPDFAHYFLGGTEVHVPKQTQIKMNDIDSPKVRGASSPASSSLPPPPPPPVAGPMPCQSLSGLRFARYRPGGARVRPDIPGAAVPFQLYVHTIEIGLCICDRFKFLPLKIRCRSYARGVRELACAPPKKKKKEKETTAGSANGFLQLCATQ